MSKVWTSACLQHCVSLPQFRLSSSIRCSLISSFSTKWHNDLHLAFSNHPKRSYATRKQPRIQETKPRTSSRESPVLPAKVNPLIQTSVQDLFAIFGKGTNPKAGRDVIQELQRRRVTGSLVDVGLNVNKIAPGVTEQQASKALAWLRHRYPVDEALAAEKYAEAAEEKYRAELEAKALESALYQKKQGEKESNGQLAIENWSEEKKVVWREQLAKAEALEKEYAEEQAEVRLAVVQQQIELAQRRDDKLAKWDELEQQAELDTEQLTDETRSAWSRLGKPLAFGAVSLVALSFVLDSSKVTEPQQGLAQRAWSAPDTAQLTPSIVTCSAITAINLILLLAWRNPAAWHSMNRLFLLSAGNPNTFSILGSVFSHQRWIMHLAANTTLLFALGMPLHDEIGRANFLAVYLGSGILASCTSLTFHVLRRNFLMASIGASGAVMGLYGAFFTVQSERAMYIPYVDKIITYDSWLAIAGFLLLEAVMFWRTKGMTYDHINHLAGLAAGTSFGYILRPKPSATNATLDEKEVQVQVDAQG